MNRALAFEFLVYGVLLAGLSLLARYLTPVLAPATLITGLAGGALAVLWGVLAMRGYQRRWWIILTLGAVVLMTLAELVMRWGRWGGDGSQAWLAAVPLTLMFVFTFGLLMNLLHGQGRQEDTEIVTQEKPAGGLASSRTKKR